MRAVISKVLTGSALAAAALAVSACGSKTETTTDNTMITDVGNDSMGTMTDNMTAVDGASNMGTMAGDTMGNGSDMMTNTMSTTTTTTTNAM